MACRPGGMSETEDDDEYSFGDENMGKKNSQEPFISTVTSESTVPGSHNSLPDGCIHWDSNSSNSKKHSDIWKETKNSRPSRGWRKHRFHHGLAVPLDDFRMAVIQGNTIFVKSLIKQGMAVDQVLKSGWTPLMYGCSCGQHETIQFLLENGADPNYHKELFTALMAACASSKENEANLVQCVDLLIRHNANPNAAERHKMTSLMFACKEGRVEIVKKLIEAKVNVNQQDNRGWTSLSWAAAKGNGHIVRLLLEAGADPAQVSSSGQTAADMALAQGYSTIAQILDDVQKTNWTPNLDTSVLTKLSEKEKHGKQNSDSHNDSQSLYKKYGDLEMVLLGLDLGDYIPLFHEHQVSFEAFLRCNENDLEKMGIQKLGVRKTILNGIKEIHKKDWEKSSLPQIQYNNYISCPEAVAMVANISKHIRYIQASIGYLRDQIQNQPRILELGQEVATVQNLNVQTEDTLKNMRAMYDELRFLKVHLDKVQDNVQYIPADLIVEKNESHSWWQRRISKLSMIITVVCGILIWKKPDLFTSRLSFLFPVPEGNPVTVTV